MEISVFKTIFTLNCGSMQVTFQVKPVSIDISVAHNLSFANDISQWKYALEI